MKVLHFINEFECEQSHSGNKRLYGPYYTATRKPCYRCAGCGNAYTHDTIIDKLNPEPLSERSVIRNISDLLM